MKKISLLLVFVLLVGAFMIPVSAQEKNYTATFSANGVFSYRENWENIINTSVYVSDIEDFTHGEIVYRYNPTVLKGAHEIIQTPLIETEKRFESEYEKGDDYTIIRFTKNGKAVLEFNDYSFSLPFKTYGTGEHELSIEVIAYNEKNEKTEYEVVYEFDLYHSVVEYSLLQTIDKSKLPRDEAGRAYLRNGEKVSVITDLYSDSEFVIIDSVKGVLAPEEVIPNGAYLATLYEGYVANRIMLYVMADVNSDGRITAADARLALRGAAKVENLTQVQRVAADVNANISVTAADARLILRKAAGLD